MIDEIERGACQKWYKSTIQQDDADHQMSTDELSKQEGRVWVWSTV